MCQAKGPARTPTDEQETQLKITVNTPEYENLETKLNKFNAKYSSKPHQFKYEINFLTLEQLKGNIETCDEINTPKLKKLRIKYKCLYDAIKPFVTTRSRHESAQ